jgi:uncharacterized protein
MISLDTNVVLRFLLGDVPEQVAASEKLISENNTYVTDVVVVEVVYVLERVIGVSRPNIVKLLKSFLGFGGVVYNPYFLLDVLDLYLQKKKLSIVDCYAIAETKAYSNKIATFDKDLRKAAGKLVANF